MSRRVIITIIKMVRDLEFGPLGLTDGMKRLIKFYNSNRHRMFSFLVAFSILSFAVIVKLGYRNVDSVIETATSITLDEESYRPFKWSMEVIPEVEDRSTRVFELKESHVNWKMQALNLAQFKVFVMEYIESVGYVCIHARHFDVPYDIIIFNNMTLVNPHVESEGTRLEYVKEISLSGGVSRHKRPTQITVTYIDEALNRQHRTLYGDQAFCFAHYNL